MNSAEINPGDTVQRQELATGKILIIKVNAVYKTRIKLEDGTRLSRSLQPLARGWGGGTPTVRYSLVNEEGGAA